MPKHSSCKMYSKKLSNRVVLLLPLLQAKSDHNVTKSTVLGLYKKLNFFWDSCDLLIVIGVSVCCRNIWYLSLCLLTL